MHSDGIHIAFNYYELLGLFLLREVQRIKMILFVINERIRRVDVFGQFTLL